MENSTAIEIKSIQVKEHYHLVAELMRGLHESEQEMFNKAANWSDIAEGYMRYIIETQEENEGTCLVAYVNDQVAGFIFGYAEDPDDSRIEESFSKELYISDGYVVHAFRRMGIYRMLNSEIERMYIANSVRRISRFTLVTNKRMQQFLEEEGYRVVRLLYEKWLDDSGDATIELKLTPPKG
ncbi:MAG: GNAT family N-acetyltransferase [Flavipsychrobacter sp.]|nr:GNAT family N-acetyltransferase [Flavipsychrobacter sp.]